MRKSLPNIFLVGPMGSGKTTIGKKLAKMLGLRFYDSDQELEHLTGASVNLIFEIEGETGFRTRETQLLKQLTAGQGVLIATGGGVVCRDENRRLLVSRGTVVYLKTSVENQLRRLSLDKNRPLLQAGDKAERLETLAQLRNPLYTAIADLTYTTGRHSIHTTSKALSRAILDHLDPLSDTGKTHAG